MTAASWRRSSRAARSARSPGLAWSSGCRTRFSEWPWPTFIANLLGAAALGYFATRLRERLPLSAYRRPLLGTGFCGGLTTFSTMQLELVRMLEDGYLLRAAAYAAASVALGFVAVMVATNLVRRARLAR